MKDNIIQLLKDFYSDRDTYNIRPSQSPFEGTAEIYEKHAERIQERLRDVSETKSKKILETLAQDLSNSTIDGRLSPTQETFNNTMFQVITKINSLIKYHYGK
jgi:hypothetical protein